MDLKRLQYFVTLLEQGSFVRAAEALHVTQSALSHSIRTLEEQAGLPLLDRGKAGLVPTRAGARLRRDAAALLRQATTLRHNLQAQAQGEAGNVRFGIGPLPAHLWLSGILAALVRAHPGITATASVTAASELADQLRQDLVEFFICAQSALPEADWFEIRPFARLPMALITRAGHPLQGRGGLVPADLAPYPLACIATDFVRAGATIEAPLFRNNQLAVQCDDCSVLRDLTLESDIVWITSALVTHKDPGRLIPLAITVDMIPTTTDMVLVSHAGRTLSPAANRVIEAARHLALLDVSSGTHH